MSYKFMISHNLGASYHPEHTSDDKEDPKFKQLADYCEKHVLRYYIEDSSGGIAGISSLHRATIDMLAGRSESESHVGRSTPYVQRSIDENLDLLRSHFKCRAK